MFPMINTVYMYICSLTMIPTAVIGTRGMPCRGLWQEYKGTCYLRYNSQLDWKGAMGTCLNFENNKYLVTIENAKLNIFIHKNITSSSDVWLGLTNGNVSNVYDWTWSDGQSVTYNDDLKATPVNSLCVIMRLSDDEKPYWHTQICTYPHGFVCEKEMVNQTCGNGWLEYEMRCYLVISDEGSKQNNMAAARYCLVQEAYLVSINNQSEAKFLYRHIQPGIEYWIGLSPLKWLDGTPFQYNNWDDIGPNKDARCVYLNHTSGKWSSGSCEGRRRFVCQKESIFKEDETNASYEATSVMNHDDMETYADNGISENDLSSKFFLTVVTPAFVCGVIIFIVILAVVCVILRRKRLSQSKNKESTPKSKTNGSHDTITDVYDTVEPTSHTDHPVVTHTATLVHSPEADTYDTDHGPDNNIVVNGDMYAVVDKAESRDDKTNNNNNTIQDIQNNTKDTTSKEQNHIVVGTDVYAIVDKEKVKPNMQNNIKQKKKKPPPPPKLEDKSDEINSNGSNHIVVGLDVYAIVDKDKVTQHKQKKPKQKKKQPAPPPKLEDNANVINERNVYYNEFNMNTVPVTPTKDITEEKITDKTGVVYADLDLSGSGAADDGCNDDEFGVVYSDVTLSFSAN